MPGLRAGAAFAVAAVAATLAAPAASAGSIQSADRVTYVISLRSGDSSQIAAEHARRHGAKVRHVYRNALRGYAATMSASAARQTAEDPRVAAVVPDRAVSIAAHTLPTGINRVDGGYRAVRRHTAR